MAFPEKGFYISTCLRRFQLVEIQSMILNVVSAVEAFDFVKVWQLTFMPYSIIFTDIIHHTYCRMSYSSLKTSMNLEARKKRKS